MIIKKTREISKNRVESLEELSGMKMSQNDLDFIEYMRNLSTNCYDLDKAKTLRDFCLAERITKDPKRSGDCEKYQVDLLQTKFFGIIRHIPNTLFISNGIITNNINIVPNQIAPDLDCSILLKNGMNVGLSLKYTDSDGTMQNHQFDELLEMINNAPNINSSLSPLVYFVSGEFWVRPRTKYQKIKYNKPGKSLIDILKIQATKINKKLLVITDTDLPSQQTIFDDFLKQRGF